MSALFASLFALVAAASEGPRLALPPGPEAEMARTYMRLVESANAFDRADALEARDVLFGSYGDSIERLGTPPQLEAMRALGEGFPIRQIDWWQGTMPEKDERYLVVWWHPNRSASRRVVLGAQAVGALHDIPIVAIVPDGVPADRKGAAGLVAICPEVTFAAAPSRILGEIDLTILPQVTVVEEGEVLWHGAWEQLRFTPLSP